MRDRCTNTNSKSYKHYGGRGIKIADPWLGDITAFVEWALQNASKPGLQLDRIDNDGPYSPENCRWVTSEENQNNRSTTVHLTIFGETKPLQYWAKDPRCNTTAANLHQRITKLGWEPETALITPTQGVLVTAFGESKSTHGWEKDSRSRVTRRTLETRLQNGWEPELAISTPGKRGKNK
jgi:hypothetical protein